MCGFTFLCTFAVGNVAKLNYFISMKNYLKMAALAAALCATASCEHIELAENPIGGGNLTTQTKKFTFTVKGDFKNPTFLDGATRANTYMQADGVEMTDLWVLDVVNGEVQQMVHQTQTDALWGSPSMKLTLGTHHIMFLASRGQEPTYADGVVTWTKPLDTFYKDYEVEVVSTSNGNRAVTLDRCAAKLTVVIEDAVPKWTSTITITPMTWYNGWNMLSGAPVAAENYSLSFSIPSSAEGQTGLNLMAWTLSTTEEWQTDVNLQAHDSGNVLTADVDIEDAPFKANRMTSYTGALWTNGGANVLSLSTDWLEPYEGVY